jgi:hypothetical protein
VGQFEKYLPNDRKNMSKILKIVIQGSLHPAPVG